MCVEFATPRGGEEEGEEEVLRRLVTLKGSADSLICSKKHRSSPQGTMWIQGLISLGLQMSGNTGMYFSLPRELQESRVDCTVL